jgi:hypothetical protein
LVSALLAVVSGVGISTLTVENSFIDYFREYTEIHRGMSLIDRKLGGTTSSAILLNFDPPLEVEQVSETQNSDDDDYFWGWDLDASSDPAYWFTPFKIDRIKQVHDYLDARPEIGKVRSLASAIRVAESLKNGEPLDGIQLSLLYKKLPSDIRDSMITPFFSHEHNEARIHFRILDSTEGLRRKDLIESIESDLRTELGFREHEAKLTGTLVLYNNMLQSLFSSQASSIGAVMAGIGITLLLLFRSFSLVVIGIVPNLLAAAIVLGLMGWMEIPLDLMTITIAAITIGIAVDNGIHYIYRFREEFRINGDYSQTLRICHANIGRAVLYTSTTIIFGFSILMLSMFMPTIYFGVLTGLAMVIAFLASLTLLPRLILLLKPF